MTSFFLAEADGISKIILENDAGFLVGEDHVPAGAVMNQMQGPNLGADLFNGTLIGLFLLMTGKQL